jgi:dTDP-4-dehydrorhamnose 3,5-epimerase
MLFTPTSIGGAVIVDVDPREDERGWFGRSWCCREFEAHGLNPRLVQCNVSVNKRKGTLRGLHYQAPPFDEAKLVRCTTGAIYDVIVDLRPDSQTFAQSVSVVLSAENRRALYIPERCAHGFLTLTDDAEVFYQMTNFYEPAAARGVRWNDPAFGVRWPDAIVVISERDLSYPDFGAKTIAGGKK